MDALIKAFLDFLKRLFGKQEEPPQPQQEEPKPTEEVIIEKEDEPVVIQEPLPEQTQLIPMKTIKVLIDNGHGATTPGKRGNVLKDGRQLLEWSYTRLIARRVEARLTELGIPCVLIVPEDDDIVLTKRANRVNEICKHEPCIMFSIHCNAANGNATGFEVWTTNGKTNSDKLAQSFLDVFHDVFPDKKCRGHKENNWTILYKSNCPCVLTENFFMDNDEECEWMLSEDGMQRITELHVRAVLNYIEKYVK